MNPGKILVASVIFAATLSAHAAFAPGQNRAQIKAEAEAQLRANSNNVAAVLAAAAAAGLDLRTVAGVLVTIPGVSPDAVQDAAAALAPRQADAIAAAIEEALERGRRDERGGRDDGGHQHHEPEPTPSHGGASPA